jgi:hypothetical protein
VGSAARCRSRHCRNSRRATRTRSWRQFNDRVIDLIAEEVDRWCARRGGTRTWCAAWYDAPADLRRA